MSHMRMKLEDILRRDTVSLATATAYKLFTGQSGTGYSRDVVNFNNTDTTADIYLKFTRHNDPQPTISATDNDLIVPAKTPVQLLIGYGVNVWVYHTKGSNATFTAVEGHAG